MEVGAKEKEKPAGETTPCDAASKVWVPERVETVLAQAMSFAEFRDRRQFLFLHLFSGVKDTLAEALSEERARNKLRFRAVSLDAKVDPELDPSTVRAVKEIEGDVLLGEFDFVHAAPPSGTFVPVASTGRIQSCPLDTCHELRTTAPCCCLLFCCCFAVWSMRCHHHAKHN